MLLLNMALVVTVTSVAMVNIRLCFVTSTHHCPVHFLLGVLESIFVKKTKLTNIRLFDFYFHISATEYN